MTTLQGMLAKTIDDDRIRAYDQRTHPRRSPVRPKASLAAQLRVRLGRTFGAAVGQAATQAAAAPPETGSPQVPAARRAAAPTRS
jgi:hypothetical protein